MKKLAITIVIAILLFIGISSATYTVRVNQYAAVREFGRIVDVKSSPGLYFKIPFVNDIQYISGKSKLYDMAASDVITKDKKSMIADNYAIWVVVNPTKYVQTLNAIDSRAEERVEAAVYNATKNVISSLSQEEVIAYRGEQLSGRITEQANSDIGEYGISIVSTQVKSLDLPDDNKQAVYDRMISERQNIAASYTAKGQAEAQKIKNETDKQVTILEADAKKQAAILEAEGEAEYMRILSEAYNDVDKAEFYNFIRGLDAMKGSLKGGNKTLILDKESELAKLLYGRF